MGGVDAPDPIDPADTGRKSLETQIELAPEVYAAEAKYRPLYAALDQRILSDSLTGANGQPGLLDIYGTASESFAKSQAAADSIQREADISDVERYGARAQKAWRDANPDLIRVMDSLETNVNNARENAPAKLSESALQKEMQSQALSELEAGGKLSAEGQRLAQQTARASAADRGMTFSNSAIFDEAMNSETLRQQRQDRALGNALAVDQSGVAASTADRAAENDQFGREISLAGLYGSMAQDPYSLVLGRSGASSMASGVLGGAGGTGGNMFDPYNSSIMNMYSGNQANQMAAATATANNNASMWSTGITSAALLAAAYMCWVARAVYGARSPKWLRFRRYLLTRAPRRLFDLYLRNGRATARRVRRDPALRERVREIMDAILERSQESGWEESGDGGRFRAGTEARGQA